MQVLVAKVEKYNFDDEIFFHQAARICGFSEATLWRYRSRIHFGDIPLQKRGRKELMPFADDILRDEIYDLDHRQKRSLGSGTLREKYKFLVSRETMDRLIGEVRAEVNRGKLDEMIRVKWHCPHLVWAMDDYFYMAKSVKFQISQVQDVTTKYKFEPLVRKQSIDGKEIAENLEKLFKEHGAPLFLKRDNGSNLNSKEVAFILKEYKVMPLNSPAYFPQYNGSIERAQREAKKELDRLTKKCKNADIFPFVVRQAVHNLNHKIRSSLHGENSCFRWSLYSNRRFSMTYRTIVYQELQALALDIVNAVNYSDKELLKTAAWRKVVGAWLQQNGHMTLKRAGKVLPVLATTDIS